MLLLSAGDRQQHKVARSPFLKGIYHVRWYSHDDQTDPEFKHARRASEDHLVARPTGNMSDINISDVAYVFGSSSQ